MKDKEGKGGQANAAFLEDPSQEMIHDKKEQDLCEIDDKSGHPTCCGPGDLSGQSRLSHHFPGCCFLEAALKLCCKKPEVMSLALKNLGSNHIMSTIVFTLTPDFTKFQT